MKGVNNIMTGCHRYETKIINGRQRCVGLKETSPGFYVLYITENKKLTCKLVWKYDTYKHPVGYSYKTGKPLNMTRHFGLEYSFKSMIQKYRHENVFSKSA